MGKASRRKAGRRKTERRTAARPVVRQRPPLLNDTMRLVGFTGLAVIAIVIAITLAGRGSSAKEPRTPPALVDFAALDGLQSSRPPWRAETTQLAQRLGAMGLAALQQEGTKLHVHAHLDLFVDGRRVVVPAGVGINLQERFISPIHTHDASGVIHVESPTVRSFSLGELFGVWGVVLRRSCLGGACQGGGALLAVWVDGKRWPGNPGQIVLLAHREIVVAVGRPPAEIPSGYDFSGL